MLGCSSRDEIQRGTAFDRRQGIRDETAHRTCCRIANSEHVFDYYLHRIPSRSLDT